MISMLTKICKPILALPNFAYSKSLFTAINYSFARKQNNPNSKSLSTNVK
jgi:hypothetical protein